MQVRIRKIDDIYCVELSGKISYDSLEVFKDACKKELVSNKVVFNCENLSFVGSIGITDFLAHLRALSRAQTKIKYVGIAKEYMKLAQSFAATKDLHFEIHKSDYEAVQAFRENKEVATPQEVSLSEVETN